MSADAVGTVPVVKSSRYAARLAWLVWGLIVAMAAVALALLVLNRSIPVPGAWGGATLRLLNPGLAFTFASVGVVIASRQTRNPIAWVFIAVGILSATQAVAIEYGIRGLIAESGDLPGALFAGWVANWIWAPLIGMVAIFIFLLFPNGSFLSRRWRTFGWSAAVVVAAIAIVIALIPGPLSFFPDVDNPTGLRGTDDWIGPLIGVLMGVFTASSVAAAASAVLRFWRADEVVRHQLKWLASAAVLVASTWVAYIFDTDAEIFQAVVVMVMGTVPIAAGVAILRYRLYEIDSLINRTFVYGPLTAILAGTYIATIQLFRWLFKTVTGDTSDASIVLTTLVVAAAFTPVKARLQTVVDRYFKEPPDPLKELRALRVQVQSVVDVLDVETAARRLLATAVAGFGAKGGAIDVDVSGEGQLSLTHGASDGMADLSMPLENRGERFGTLSLDGRHDGRPYSAEDEEMLRQVAGEVSSAIGLTLRLGTGA